MKFAKRLFSLTMIFVTLLSSFLCMPKLNAASYKVYISKYKCPIRLAPSEHAANLKNGNDNVYVYQNQLVTYLSTSYGPNKGLENQEWYKIRFDYAAREYTGFIAKACMYDPVTYTYSDDTKFEESIKAFPDSYKPYLRVLHAMHPNWAFKIDKTGLNWETAAEAESQKGTSAISYLYPSLIFKDSSNPNGIVVDGSSWYAPAKDAVKYYMDPRNFLNEKNIFMFETLSYDVNQDSSVSEILKGSFMSGSFTEGDVTKTYAAAFIEAAKTANVSSIHLASRALQEMGYTMSSAASGTVAGYEGIYNFYNIGAYSGADNYLKGLEYAKNAGWNSRQRAITGGAQVIGQNYIVKGQDTIYFQKFNVSGNRKLNAYTHQYMTNIMAPYSESSSIYDSYKSSNRLNSSITFTIPVYDNMPATAFKVTSTDTVGGTEEKTEEEKKEEENKKEETENKSTPEQKIKDAGYVLKNGFITNVSGNSDVSELRNKFYKLGHEVAVTDSNWNSKVSGKLSTGDKLSIDNKVYEIIIYGDSTGDGVINSKDLLSIQKYILGQKEFSGVFKESSDVNKDGAINSKDLLRIQKAILGLAEIK